MADVDLVLKMELFAAIVKAGRSSAGELAVAFTLLFRFHNSVTGRCDPGRTVLAQECGLSQSAVKRAVAKLAGEGWFTVRLGAGTMSKFGPTTAYQPAFDRVAPTPRVGVDAPPYDVNDQGAQTPRVVVEGMEGGASTPPGTIYTNHPKTLSSQREVPTSPELDLGHVSEASSGRTCRAPKGTRFPQDAVLPVEWRDWSLERRPDLDPEQVFIKFKRIFTGADCRRPIKKDWTRAWQNFVEGERSNGPGNRRQAQKPGFGAAVAAGAAVVARLQERQK